MVKLLRKRSHKAGLPPGSLVYIGEKKGRELMIRVLDYTASNVIDKEVKTVEECFTFKRKKSVTWINIDGVHRIDVIQKIGEHFELHPLMMEDILNTEQRPKIDNFGEHLFVVLKMFSFNGAKNEISSEQISLVLGPGYILSFQETIGDVFDAVRERIRKGRFRKRGADYLLYALIDAIVDSYFSILEQLGEKIAKLEEELIDHPDPETVENIHVFRREMLFLRKSIWPLREVLGNLQRTESKLIQKSTLFYLRDVHDHAVQIIDTTETFRDMLSGMLDIYLSAMSNRMNEVMKVLTIIGTIFIPLTFVTGLYGMNFDFMPELQWKYGYVFAISVMMGIVLSMLYYFKRKGWI